MRQCLEFGGVDFGHLDHGSPASRQSVMHKEWKFVNKQMALAGGQVDGSK